MAKETLPAVISEFETVLSTINNVHDARKMVALAQGFITTARKEYRASELTNEVKEDRDRAYDTAVKAGELRLMAEAKLGELIISEREAGRLAKQTDNQFTSGTRNGTSTLKNIGITFDDSARAQKIAEHKDLIPEVVSTAIKNRDIPTRKQMESLILEKQRQSGKEARATQARKDYPEGANILDGDMALLNDAIQDNTVSLFFTDPPYDLASVELFERLALLANAKLKDGGLLLTYSGQTHLPLVINAMAKYLDYWWTFAVLHSGAELRIWSKRLWNTWKPIIVFSKPGQRLTNEWVMDYIRGSGEDKEYHKWGQPVQEATYWIETLTKADDLVVDPFCGGGTIPLACLLTGRQWLATEINPENASLARQRLNEAKNEQI